MAIDGKQNILISREDIGAPDVVADDGIQLKMFKELQKNAVVNAFQKNLLIQRRNLNGNVLPGIGGKQYIAVFNAGDGALNVQVNSL